MFTRIWGEVVHIEAERDGIQNITVQVGDEVRRAICYPELTGRVEVGNRVLLNTVAVELNLGTGGSDFVIAIADTTIESEPPGHLIKLRYTPLQVPVLAVEAPESPHHNIIAQFETLAGTPVVCLELHSQLAAICAAAKSLRNVKIAYIMTDGAALPLAYSRLVSELKTAKLLDTTITIGQAFGGDYEAISLFSGLAAAKVVCGADIIIVGQGPGNAGTGTALGFSGIEQGIAANAAYSLGGVPIVVPRLSFADARERHQGISHHTLTVLCRVVLCPVIVPFPVLPQAQTDVIAQQWRVAQFSQVHEWITREADTGLLALERSGIAVTTMGRTLEQERPFFLAAAAAGLVAVERLP